MSAVMADAGLDSGDITNDYVNSLNGFSALITHAEAVKLAATSKVCAGDPRRAPPVPHRLQRPSSSGSPVVAAPTPPVTPVTVWSSA